MNFLISLSPKLGLKYYVKISYASLTIYAGSKTWKKYKRTLSYSFENYNNHGSYAYMYIGLLLYHKSTTT